MSEKVIHINRGNTTKARNGAIDVPIKPDMVTIEPVPSIFIDGFMGVTSTPESVRLNLYEDRLVMDNTSLIRYTVARLVMPKSVFNDMVDALNDIRDELSKV